MSVASMPIQMWPSLASSSSRVHRPDPSVMSRATSPPFAHASVGEPPFGARAAFGPGVPEPDRINDCHRQARSAFFRRSFSVGLTDPLPLLGRWERAGLGGIVSREGFSGEGTRGEYTPRPTGAAMMLLLRVLPLLPLLLLLLLRRRANDDIAGRTWGSEVQLLFSPSEGKAESNEDAARGWGKLYSIYNTRQTPRRQRRAAGVGIEFRIEEPA
jgi:hypothetical protein